VAAASGARRTLQPEAALLRSGVRKKPSDEHAFLRKFIGDPRRTGAVAPSGPFLAREMARAVDPHEPGLVIELGPGTGPVTKALIARGIGRDRLLLIEYDPHFCRLLCDRYGAARVLRGDAYALAATLADRAAEPVAAVVSSLPLLNEKPERRLQLLDEAFALMGPDGVFVQFTYGLKSPIPREALAGRYVARSGAPVLRNLPPASVWTFRKPGPAPAKSAKVMRLVDHCERLGAEFVARRKKTEHMLGRQGDRVMELLKREVASLRETEEKLERHGDRVLELLKREVASFGRRRDRDR
jgi:phosphatidylethanolamine/phosphatidyl-N-methylethanolamine N-methyltransferase